MSSGRGRKANDDDMDYEPVEEVEDVDVGAAEQDTDSYAWEGVRSFGWLAGWMNGFGIA